MHFFKICIADIRKLELSIRKTSPDYLKQCIFCFMWMLISVNQDLSYLIMVYDLWLLLDPRFALRTLLRILYPRNPNITAPHAFQLSGRKIIALR